MSLGKLARRLKDRDWASVAIEILIVFVGVIIALQVSNWNDARKDSARGQEYLQRLQAEFLKDAGSLESISGFWTQVRDNGMIAMAYAENGTVHEGSAWKTLLAYYQASQLWPYRKSDITFQEMRSNGDLMLIRNPALRTRIANHHSAGAGSQVVEVLGLIPAYRENVRGMTPWHIQQYIWAKCYQSSAENRQQLLDCKSPISEAEAQAVLNGYRQAPELTRGLRFWMVNVNNGLMLMRGIKAEAETLAQDVRSESAP